MKCSIPVEPLAKLHIIEKFQNSRSTFEYQNFVVHLSTKISIGTEMGFTSNLDKMNKTDILNGIQIRMSLKSFFCIPFAYCILLYVFIYCSMHKVYK